MARKAADSAPERLPNLTIARAEAHKRIKERIAKGAEIRSGPISDQHQLDAADAEKRTWTSYNSELLRRIFDNSAVADEYNRPSIGYYSQSLTLASKINDFRESVDERINRLEQIAGRLDLIPAPDDVSSSTPAIARPPGREVFLVHGHDQAARETVARFLERLELIPIILHEQPNQGSTIAEKLEGHSDVGFAVVLLTPDDIGGPKDAADGRRPRTRQNVVFELGYFIGKLGRSRVCALYKESLELPSDYQGILYVPMTSDWQLQLARELKAANIDFDMNKVL